MIDQNDKKDVDESRVLTRTKLNSFYAFCKDSCYDYGVKRVSILVPDTITSLLNLYPGTIVEATIRVKNRDSERLFNFEVEKYGFATPSEEGLLLGEVGAIKKKPGRSIAKDSTRHTSYG